MIRIEKDHLPVLQAENESMTVRMDDLCQALTEHPAHIVYVEYEGRFAGGISFGDIVRAAREGRDSVPVNRQMTVLSSRQPMQARALFRENRHICEIPVVDDGKLTGEYHRFDDLLLLEHALPFEANRYRRQYWESVPSVVLVKPPADHELKQRVFREWKAYLESCGVSVTEICHAEAGRYLDGGSPVIFLDEQEKRGSRSLIWFADHVSRDLSETKTCAELLRANKLDPGAAAAVFDYLRGHRIRVMQLAADPRDGDDRLEDLFETTGRRVREEGSQYEILKNHARGFFDDLYTPEYERDIEKIRFFQETGCAFVHLSDCQTRYCNVVNGERVTTDQPEEYVSTVWFFGQCLIVGQYVEDRNTIESFLQRMFNEEGRPVRVVNCGFWGDMSEMLLRIAATPLREGDTVVFLNEQEPFPHCETLWLTDVAAGYPIRDEWILDCLLHCNHRMNRLYAAALFEALREQSANTAKERGRPILQEPFLVRPLYIDRYFYDWKPETSGVIAGCIINGNPFTEGHRYLLETASRENDAVILFVVEEEASVFSFAERFAMAVEAVADLENVHVFPSGIFFGTRARVPEYFGKVFSRDLVGNTESESRMFAQIARFLGITKRYCGEEPADPITNELNKAMRRILPAYGITPVELKRKETGGQMVTGRHVRELAETFDRHSFAGLAPAATVEIIGGKRY